MNFKNIYQNGVSTLPPFVLPDEPYLNVRFEGPENTDNIGNLVSSVHQVSMELNRNIK